MIAFPIVALLIGLLLGMIVHMPPVPGEVGQYLAVMCLAGIDTVCGGARSILEDKFRNDVFLSGFVSNVAIAFFLAWLGDKIYINLFLAVALVLGTRIYTNLSLIRRFLMTRIEDARKRKERQAMANPASVNPEVPR
jgi:small basic protein